MPKATPTASTESLLVALSHHIVAAEISYRMILTRTPDVPGRPDATAAAQLKQAVDNSSTARKAMAGIRADTSASCYAKVRALMANVTYSNKHEPIVNDDDGLVLSLLQDLTRLSSQTEQDSSRAPYADALDKLALERGATWRQAALALAGVGSFHDIPAADIPSILAWA